MCVRGGRGVWRSEDNPRDWSLLPPCVLEIELRTSRLGGKGLYKPLRHPVSLEL